MGTNLSSMAVLVLGLAGLWATQSGVAMEMTEGEDSVKVEIRGTLRTGVVAIGGETTGTTVSAKDMTFEVDLRGDPKLQTLAEKLDGRKAIVRGSLVRKKGIEIPERWIITPTDLQPAGPPAQ